MLLLRASHEMWGGCTRCLCLSLSKYLNVVVVVVVLQMLAPVGRIPGVLPPRVERVHHDLLGALDFRPAEGATLVARLEEKEFKDCNLF